MKKITFLLMLLSFITFSCKKNEEESENFKFGKGLFVLNEGVFTAANSSLSFFNLDKNTIENNVFYKVNKGVLGDVANSLNINDNKLFVVVNNSGFIYKTSAETLELEGKLDGLYSPRHIHFISPTKAYISDMVSTSLTIFNPTTMEKLGEIELNATSEAMAQIGDEVFVSNWSNYYAPTTSDHSVQVINTKTDQVVATINTSAAPNSMVVDKNDNLWVLCGGSYDENTWAVKDAKLLKINSLTKNIKEYDFPAGFDSPSELRIDDEKTTLYFIYKDVYKMSIDSNTLPTQPFISSEGRSLYGLAVSNNDIFVTDAKDYFSNGTVTRYDVLGNEIVTLSVGICPRSMIFN